MLTNPKWPDWQTSFALSRVSRLAKELDGTLIRIYQNANSQALARMDKTALGAIEISEITEAAEKLADELQSEADAEVT